MCFWQINDDDDTDDDDDDDEYVDIIGESAVICQRVAGIS